MDLEKIGKHLYFLIVLDPLDGREQEGEILIRPFAEKGFRNYNVFTFVSSVDLKEIVESIQKNKTERFQYLLFDMTTNLSEETFKGVLNPKYYQHAAQAAKIIQDFKPKKEEVNLSKQERVDLILDKINRLGENSLTNEDKEFLKNI